MNIADLLSELLPDVQISEDFVQKLTSSLEVAVAQRVEEEKAEWKKLADDYSAYVQTQMDELKEKANEYADYVAEELTEKLDSYCDYVVEQFLEESKEALIETEEYNRMADTLRTIREAFETHYFLLDEKPANKKLQEQVDSAKHEFNTLFEENRKLKEKIEEFETTIENEKRKSIFESKTKDLADSQKEKVERLMQSSSFKDISSYEKALDLFIEEFKKEKTESTKINEEVSIPPSPAAVEATVDEKMKRYLNALI